MELDKLQEYIKSFDNDGDIDEYFKKLIEEVGELSSAIRKNKLMSGDNIKDTIEEELVDVLYYTVCLANKYEISLNNCFKMKDELNKIKYNRK